MLPTTSRTPRSWLNLAFWMALCAILFIRNLPGQAPLRQAIKPIDEAIITPLGLEHFGWMMFDSRITSSPLGRVVYIYQNGTTRIDPVFPIRSSIKREVWTEVMEDYMRRLNQPINEDGVQGFMRYQCQHISSPAPLARIELHIADVPLQEIWTNNGHPYLDPQYQTIRALTCQR